MDKTRTYQNRTKVAVILTILALIAIIALSGTLAKYISNSSATATARVAAFSANLSETGTINLYDTLMETDFSTAETNVEAHNGTDKIIAPGTGGQYPIEIVNNSEVDVRYDIVVNLASDSSTLIPVELCYSQDAGTSWSEWAPISTFATTTAPITGDIDANTTGTTDVLIRWRWAFTDSADPDTRDAADTALGESVLDGNGGISATAPKLSVENNVTFTQID